MKYRYILNHEHKFGVSTYEFTSNLDNLEQTLSGYSDDWEDEWEDSPNLQKICRELGTDFEPHRGEVVEIILSKNQDSITHIEL